jgi:hypothetical protein
VSCGPWKTDRLAECCLDPAGSVGANNHSPSFGLEEIYVRPLYENAFFLNIEIEIEIGIGIEIGIEIEIAFHASLAQACLRFGRHVG